MTSSFINDLAQHIKDHYDLQHESLTVVFPNKRAAFYLRSRFKSIYSCDIWMPQILSIEEAVTQWSGLQMVDSVDLLFELISIAAELGSAGDMTIFGSIASQMAKDFDEMDQYAVDADHLFSYIYEEKKIGIWNFENTIKPKERAYLEFFKRLKVYYDQLRQRLLAQGKGYYGLITRMLSEMDISLLQKKTGNQRVLFAGFNALTPTEQKLIDKLYKNGQAEVVWDFDRYYVEDPLNEAGFFARWYMNQDVPWKPTVFSNHLLTEQKEIHLVGVAGNTIQAKALQSLLEVETKHDIAVILADENLMIPVLNSIPDQTRYDTIKVSMGYPLSQTALHELISEFFTLHRKGKKVSGRGWYLWPILRVLSLEIVRVIFTQKELEEINSFLSYVKAKTLFIYQEEDLLRFCSSVDIQNFMSLLLKSNSKTDTPLSLLECLIDLLKFIGAKIQTGGQTNVFLLNQVSEAGKAVNRLKNILERHEQAIHSLAELEVLYRLVNKNISVKLNNSSLEGLQLMGILEARNLDFDTYYMIGVNEGILPAEKPAGSFIPYHIRKECGLPGYQEKQAVYAYHFYRQLQSAEKAYFIYNSSSNDNRGEPSRFLMQIKYELAQRNPRIHLFEDCFLNLTQPSHPSPPLFAVKTPEIMEKLMNKVQSPHFNDALAPTSLSTFIACPLKFFFKYLMKISDNRAEEETKDNEIGTVVHDTLERLYQNCLNILITKDFFCENIKPFMAQRLEESINKYFGQGLPNVGYNYLNKLNIDKQLSQYLKFEEDAIQRDELYIISVEYTLHATIMVHGVPCLIAGKADRIERRGSMIRIVDYKTGTVSDKDVKVPNNVVSISEIPEKALQLLIYKYLYLREHPEVAPEQVTASIFGLRMPQVIFDLRVDDQNLNERFMETMESYLTEVLVKMMDPAIPFNSSDVDIDKLCKYCDYKELCVNTSKESLLEDDH